MTTPDIPARPVTAKPATKPGKKKTDWLEVALKVVTPLLTVAGLFIGVWQFNRQQGFNDSQEFKRKIWERRLDAYTEIGNLTASLVTSTGDTARFDSLTHRFEQLYWGRMPLIEDQTVEEAMRKFNAELYDFKNRDSDLNRLKGRGYELMKACQQSLHNSWKTLSNES
jgi:hypothetical protein